jgi:hypothetical protein
MTVAARPKARRDDAGRPRRVVPSVGTGVATAGRQDSIAESAGCRHVSFTTGAGRLRVWGTAFFSSGGLSVNCVGGDRPHIGAVAIGIPRPSLARSGRRSATTSVFAVTGHKDDELARSMANELARRLGVTAVVVAGVHIAHATPSDIAAVLRNADDAVRAILASAAPTGRQGRRRQ